MAGKPNTAEPEKPRRWFQFRLRTLLIGVVLLGAVCGYVGREARIVAERRAWLETHHATTGFQFMAGKTYSKNPDMAPSKVHRWLGDGEYYAIFVRSDADVASAEALFPEAIIVRFPPPPVGRFAPQTASASKSHDSPTAQ